MRSVPHPCACGCGRLTRFIYVRGHNFTAKKRPLEERFWEKVDKPRSLIRCWVFSGFRNEDGYGLLQDTSRRSIGAHRLAYILTHGAVPKGLVVRHRCDNPACCRPSHLEIGTKADNNRDMAERKRHRIYTHPEMRNQGETNGQAKLRDAEVVAIVAEYRAGGVSQRTLASRYGIAQQTLSKYVRGKRRAN